MVGAGVPLRTMVNTAGAGAMFGLAVYLAHTINLEGWAPGALSAAVAALTVMAVFLVGPQAKSGEEAAVANPRGRHEDEPAHIIESELHSVSAAREFPARALPTPPAPCVSDTKKDVRPAETTKVQKQSVDQLNDVSEQTTVVARGYSPLGRVATGWKMASFILEPSEAAWCEIQVHLARAGRPPTVKKIEAVVSAARRLWHAGNVPHMKDAFIADVIASPEVKAVGKPLPRPDVVRKVLDGKHPTLIRAARINRTA